MAPIFAYSPQTPLHSWSCSLREDLELAGTLDVRPVRSIGFLQMVAPRPSKSGRKRPIPPGGMTEAGMSHACLRATFGPEVNLTIAGSDLTPASLGCNATGWVQHGTKEERACFAALGAAKFEAARASPYDLTILLDTDVFANPSHWARRRLLDDVRRRFESGSVDIMGAQELARLNWGLDDMMNVGFVIYRKSHATDRVFACAARFIRTAIAAGGDLIDQDAFYLLMHSRMMRSVAFRYVLPNWHCRGTPPDRDPRLAEVAHDVVTIPCLFVHTHASSGAGVSGCPLSNKTTGYWNAAYSTLHHLKATAISQEDKAARFGITHFALSWASRERWRNAAIRQFEETGEWVGDPPHPTRV